MTSRTNRVRVRAEDIAHLAREGIGWGHDLDGGSFLLAAKDRPQRRRRWFSPFGKRG